MSSTSIRLDEYIGDDSLPVDPDVEIGEDGVPTLSMGEDAVVDGDYQQVVMLANEAYRLSQVKTALEDLEEIAGSIQEATQKDVLLVDTAITTAVAGMDVDSEEIVPAIEQYVGKRINLEGIGSFISGIWKMIMSILNRIWAMISKFFTGLFGRAKRSEKKAKKLVEQFQKKQTSKMKTGAFMLGGEAEQLVFKGTVPHAAHDLEAGLKASEELLDAMPGFITKVEHAGTELRNAIQKFNENDAMSSLRNVVDSLKDITYNNSGLVLHKLSGDKRYGEGVFAGYQLMNNKWVTAKLPLERKLPEYSHPLPEAGGANGTQYEVDTNVPNFKSPNSNSFKGIEGHEGVKLAQMVESISNKLNNFISKYGQMDVKSKALKDVVRECDALSSRLKSKEDSLDAGTKSAYKAAVGTSIMYNALLTKFIAQVTQTISVSLAASNTLLSRALDNLE